MENVYGLAYGNQNRAVLERFIKRIRAAGYSFDRKVVLAADYALPRRSLDSPARTIPRNERRS